MFKNLCSNAWACTKFKAILYIKILITFQMATSGCFRKGVNLKNLDFCQKSFIK